jgi:2-desacetyl-2-hydroxyethyl bacteriochlorophyllide A dehydrogenase
MVGPTATSLWVIGRQQVERRQEALPTPSDTEIVVETRYSGISRGTERLVFHGLVPLSESQRMRCPFQQGDFPFPVKYGYAAVGRVISGPSELVDRTVFALHPHQDRFVIPAEAAVPVPAAVPAGRAVLAANMETALNGVWDGGIGPGMRVAVVGAGVVGLLVARLVASMPGCEVLVVDSDARKEAVCRTLALPFVHDAPAAADFDVVVHASGQGSGLATALALAGYEATIVELSWFGEASVALPLGAAFHAKRLTLRSSQVGGIAPAQRARWSHRQRLAKALDLLADPALDALISGESSFASVAEAFADILDGPDLVLCHRIRYRA